MHIILLNHQKTEAEDIELWKWLLKSLSLKSEDIQYVNAHGTSTPVGDMIELSAVERLFGSNEKLHMSSNKSSIGHFLGAAGAVEAVFSLKSLQTEILPPNLNLDNPDTSTKINLYST